MTPGDKKNEDGKPPGRKTRKRKPRAKSNPTSKAPEPTGPVAEESLGLDSKMDSGQAALGIYQPDSQRNMLQEILTWKKLALMQSPSVKKWLQETQLNIALSNPQDLIKSLEEAIRREKAENAQSSDHSDSNSEGTGADDLNAYDVNDSNTGTQDTGISESVLDVKGEGTGPTRKGRTARRKRSRIGSVNAPKILEMPCGPVEESPFEVDGVPSSRKSAFETGRVDPKESSQDCSVFVPSGDCSAFEPSAFQPGTSQMNTLQLKAIRDSISNSGAPSSLAMSTSIQQSSASSSFLTEAVVGQRMNSKTSVARMLKFSERNQFKPVQQESPLASPEIFPKQVPSLPSLIPLTSSPGITSSQKYPILRDQLATPEKIDTRPLKEKCNLLSGLLSRPDSRSADPTTVQGSSQLSFPASQQQASSLFALDLAAIFSEASSNSASQPQPISINSAPASPTEFKEQLKQASQLLQNYNFKLPDTLGQQNQTEMDDFFDTLSSGPSVENSCVQGSVPASPVEMFPPQPQQDFGMGSLPESRGGSLNASPVNLSDNLSTTMTFGSPIPENSAKFDNFAVPAPPTPIMGIYTKQGNVMTQQEGIMAQTKSQNTCMSPVHSRMAPLNSPSNFSGSGLHHGDKELLAWEIRRNRQNARVNARIKERLGNKMQKLLQQKGQQSLTQGLTLQQQTLPQLGLLQGQQNLTQQMQQGLQHGQVTVGLHTGLPQVSPVVQRPAATRTNQQPTATATNQQLNMPSTLTSGSGMEWHWPVDNQNFQGKQLPVTQTSQQVPGQRVSLESLLAKSQPDQQQPMSLQGTGSQQSSNQWMNSNPGQDML